ncbi:hypothetical protein DL93DRAFT_215888 [Clavulina sp. PMI_390]|nr:hypothetical protein DL93DRAFT_215888 [Clavulina sp. PMI_390]
MERASSPPRRAHTADPRLSPPTSPPRSHTHSSKPSLSRPAGFAISPKTPRRILIPTTRSWPPPHLKVSGRSNSRHSRRHTSLDLTSPNSAPPAVPEHAWLNHLAKLDIEIVETGVELIGYQTFLVEQWLVDRSKIVRTVTIFTGSPKDRISVSVLGPAPNVSEEAAEALFQKTLLEFRRDSARPKETEHGVIMTTSLGSFRSDLNIVHVPTGEALPVLDDLFVNINLGRLGASGRIALSLDEPSLSSKEKFLQMYGIPETSGTLGNRAAFTSTMLELVRAVQSALSIFGLYSLAADERDGLVCNSTVEGMQKWVDMMGPTLQLEPMERILDPPAVAALLGTVAALKVKLSAFASPQLPKDPFLDPAAFLHAIPTSRREQQLALTADRPQDHRFVTPEMLKRINQAYLKTRTVEPYKVHRVLKSKFDDLTNAASSSINMGLRSAATSDAGSIHHSSPPATISSINGISPSARLEGLADAEIRDIKTLSSIATNHLHKSDIAPSLRDIWLGRPGYHRQAREAEASARMAASSSLSAKYPLGLGGFWDDMEDNSYASAIWRGTGAKVQRKGQALAHGLAGLAGMDGISRRLRHGGDGHLESDSSKHPSLLPSVVITSDKSPVGSDGEDRDIPHQHGYPSAASSYRSPASSVTNLSDYDRGIRRFNNTAAPLDVLSLRAIGVTHSDPTTFTLARARENHAALLLPGADNVRAANTSVESVASPLSDALGAAAAGGALSAAFQFPGPHGTPDGKIHQRWKRQFAGAEFKDDMAVVSEAIGEEGEYDSPEDCHVEGKKLSRRRTISNLQDYEGLPILDKEYLEIDVDIAYQYLSLREKEADMRNAAAILEVSSHPTIMLILLQQFVRTDHDQVLERVQTPPQAISATPPDCSS